ARGSLNHHLQLQRARLTGLDQHLAALNPLAVLARGYAVVSQPDGTILRQRAQARPGDQLNVRVQDGDFFVEVSDET
ncbi:MAG: hypothetical protein MUO62_16490, partial [Anaerolineales bacterium]|nr:hypothetical protein [Anaerolineales bacterium]